MTSFWLLSLALASPSLDARAVCEARLARSRPHLARFPPRRQVRQALQVLSTECPEALGALVPLARRASGLPREARSRALASAGAMLDSTDDLLRLRWELGVAPEVVGRLDVGTFLFSAAAVKRGLGLRATLVLQQLLLAVALEADP